MSVWAQSEDVHKQATATRWELKKVLEIPGCLQWLWDGALPMRPMVRGKRPYASTHGSWTLIMGTLKSSFKSQRGHNQNRHAALGGYRVLIFFPQPGSRPAQGLSPHGCTVHGAREDRGVLCGLGHLKGRSSHRGQR